LVLIGEDAKNIESQLKGHAAIIRADSMEDAVAKSAEAGEAGDAVLLAPACASFDMFRTFEHRGQTFKTAVAGLQTKKHADA
jgi:UDP-N-acetylmuramoylalanine--D-glutamate ligase